MKIDYEKVNEQREYAQSVMHKSCGLNGLIIVSKISPRKVHYGFRFDPSNSLKAGDVFRVDGDETLVIEVIPAPK